MAHNGMSEADELAQKAIVAFNSGNPQDARKALLEALELDPGRIDLMHSLAVCHLQLGEPQLARAIAIEAESIAKAQADEKAGALIAQIVLARAAACEDMADPAGAEAAYREVLSHEPDHPHALSGLGYLLLAWGRADEGASLIDQMVEAGNDMPEVIDANRHFLTHLKAFQVDDIHPREFLAAHRGSYVEFFDHHARQMEEKGWIAEAARMMRDDEGRIVPVIPEGARPYAAVRVDLVDPSTGQPGLVGDQPMLVGIEKYDGLAQAPVLFPWPGEAYPRWVSSQCPWDQLLVQLRFEGDDAQIALDADHVIGDWYTAGFDGQFGSAERGRFHYISDPDTPEPSYLAYHVDCGRAEMSCIDDLFRRLGVLHAQHPLKGVALGRGYLPKG